MNNILSSVGGPAKALETLSYREGDRDVFIDSWEAVRHLSPEHRYVIVLHACGFTYEELKLILGVENTRRLHRAAIRQMVKRCVSG